MDKPEALLLADAIDPLTRRNLDNLTCAAAAAELRRLHAENERLHQANEAFSKRQEWWNEKMFALGFQRDALLEALKPMIDLAEFWINHRQERRMSEGQYKVWIALGHESNAMLKARAAIKMVEGENHAKSL